MDRVALKGNIPVRRGELTIVNTGMKMQAPRGTYIRIATMPGMSKKRGVSVGAGVVDRGYTGEIMVALFNHGEKDYKVKKGWKIAKAYVQTRADQKDKQKRLQE